MSCLQPLLKRRNWQREIVRQLEVEWSVLGTELDCQNIDEQIDKLVVAGMTIGHTNVKAGFLAREFVVKGA